MRRLMQFPILKQTLHWMECYGLVAHDFNTVPLPSQKSILTSKFKRSKRHTIKHLIFFSQFDRRSVTNLQSKKNLRKKCSRIQKNSFAKLTRKH